jgi:DHA1 family inner membrane transport protein
LAIATSRLPRRRLLLLLMGAFVCASICCALAPSYPYLLAARVLVACVHGLFFGVAMVIATRLAPSDRQATAVSLALAGFTLANTIGVPLGTAIGDALGWRTLGGSAIAAGWSYAQLPWFSAGFMVLALAGVLALTTVSRPRAEAA